MGIREVAKRAGVSVSTVSRTVNKIRAVNPDIAAKVWKAVEEVGYVSNTQARALVSGRSRMLGLIVSDITNPFFPELIQGFEREAVRAGFEVLLGSTNYDPAQMSLAVRRMIERKVEGVAVMTSEMANSLIAQLTGRNIPLAFIDVGPKAPHVSNIEVNYVSGLREAVDHLYQLGHRRLAFIRGPVKLKSARLRCEAFRRAIAAHKRDMPPGKLVQGDHNLDGGLRAIRELLVLPDRPTAVICSNDLTAIGVLHGLDAEGLRAPHDMSVVGFDDIRVTEFTLPPLTTIQLSRQDLARLALQALTNDIETSVAEQGATYQLGTRLIVRDSTVALLK